MTSSVALLGMKTGKYMSVDGTSRDARRLAAAQQKDASAKGKQIDRMMKGGIDPQTGGFQAPVTLPGREKTIYPVRGEKKGPIATTGQPTIPGRNPGKPTRLPRGEFVRDIVESKMKQIRKAPKKQLAAMPIDRNFSA